MRFLVAYQSIEGQTAKIAKFVEEELTSLGNDVIMFNTADAGPAPSFDEIDQIVLAAPVHERRHPQGFEVFLRANQDKLNARPTLFLSVSLNAAFHEGIPEANDYATEMKMRTGLNTTRDLLVAGAINTGEYDYYARQVLRWVVMRGRDFDPNVQQHEFTDWDVLRLAVTKFATEDVGTGS